MEIMNKSGVACCFCNLTIESDSVNPCDINLLTNWDKAKDKQHSQFFWCHLECFKEKLHKDIQQHLVVHLLTSKD